jgi:hypothetical protein
MTPRHWNSYLLEIIFGWKREVMSDLFVEIVICADATLLTVKTVRFIVHFDAR